MLDNLYGLESSLAIQVSQFEAFSSKNEGEDRFLAIFSTSEKIEPKNLQFLCFYQKLFTKIAITQKLIKIF